MLVYLIYTVIIFTVLISLWTLPKSTQWEKPDHRWFSYTFRSWLKNRPSMIIGAYTLRGKNLSPRLDNTEALGDQRGDGGMAVGSVVDASAVEGETVKYPFEIMSPKTTQVMDYTGFSMNGEDSDIGEARAAAQRLLEKYDSGLDDFSSTHIDPIIPQRMKALENQEDMKLVSSLARAKNPSYQKPFGAQSKAEAIQHIRGVKRFLS